MFDSLDDDLRNPPPRHEFGSELRREFRSCEGPSEQLSRSNVNSAGSELKCELECEFDRGFECEFEGEWRAEGRLNTYAL